MFAGACKKRGARVRLLLSHPGPIPNTAAEVWWHDEELGVPLDQHLIAARHNRWLQDTARMEAQATENGRLYGLVILNACARRHGREDPRHSEDPYFFVDQIRECRSCSGEVQVIKVPNVSSQLEPGRPILLRSDNVKSRRSRARLRAARRPSEKSG